MGQESVIRRVDQLLYLLYGADLLMPGQEIPQFALYDSKQRPAGIEAKNFRENAIRNFKLEA